MLSSCADSLRSTYIGYWVAIIVTLVTMKWKEGRTEVCGVRSKRGWQREWAKRQAAREQGEEEGLLGSTD
jgi:high-affinity iron transporter